MATPSSAAAAASAPGAAAAPRARSTIAVGARPAGARGFRAGFPGAAAPAAPAVPTTSAGSPMGTTAVKVSRRDNKSAGSGPIRISPLSGASGFPHLGIRGPARTAAKEATGATGAATSSGIKSSFLSSTILLQGLILQHLNNRFTEATKWRTIRHKQPAIFRGNTEQTGPSQMWRHYLSGSTLPRSTSDVLNSALSIIVN